MTITEEQIERWHKRDCSRCGRHGWFAANWPDGYVCRACHDRAVKLRGRCPGCGADRALPGRRPGDQAAICADCAGFTTSIACSRCGFEGKLHDRRLCTRCALEDRLDEFLDDGTGRTPAELVPLRESLLAADQPLSVLTWLYMRPGKTGAAEDLLRRLGTGQIALTHEAFHALQPWRAAAHMRELLMNCGVLPKIDKQICSFERWLIGHLAAIGDPKHARIIKRYATWEVLPRMRERAEHKPITPASRSFSGSQVKTATGFLTWLAEHGLTLDQCSQAEIDRWHAEHHAHARSSLRSFLTWCAANRRTRRFELPAAVIPKASPLSQQQRLSILGRLLTSEDIPLRTRVAGSIVLLYAQPLTRVVRLALDDVIHDGDQVFLRLGEPPTPVPAPFADLLLRWVAGRDNMNTATNHDSTWLFPGRRAGEPMNPNSLAALVNKAGVSTAGRAAAIRQHVLEMPAPVVADALTYHYKTTARLSTETGTDWSRYAAGNHGRLRTPDGWQPQRTRDS